MQRCLENSGFGVAGPVTSAAAALEQIDRRPPDIVLIDIRIEGPTDGISLAEQVRVRWGLPVVYVTGYGDGEAMERLVKSEPHGYVSKPFDEPQLRGAVELALSVAERERRQRRELDAVRGYATELQASASAMEGRLGQIADVLREAGVVRLDLHPGLSPDLASKIHEMSRRELEVLQFLLSSRRVASIAREMSISAYNRPQSPPCRVPQTRRPLADRTARHVPGDFAGVRGLPDAPGRPDVKRGQVYTEGPRADDARDSTRRDAATSGKRRGRRNRPACAPGTAGASAW